MDTITNTKIKNLKELRTQHAGKPYRSFFVFDPLRQAILLCGGDKTGDKRFYRRMIALAEQLYDDYLTQFGGQKMKQFKPISHLKEQFSDESKKRISEQVAKMNADMVSEQSDNSTIEQVMHSKHLPVADDIYQWLQKDGKNPSVQLNEILHKVMQGDLKV